MSGIKVYEIGYMLEDIRVRFLKDIKLNIFDINIDAKQDDTNIIPRWLANILREMKIVEINKQDIGVELIRALSREKISGNEQLTQLKPDFYIKIRSSFKDYEGDKNKLTIYLNDLIDARLWKILNLARSTPLTVELEQKLTIEEKILFNAIYKAINEFKSVLKDVKE